MARQVTGLPGSRLVFDLSDRNNAVLGHLTQIEAVYQRNDQDGDGRLSRDEYNSLVNRRH